MESTFTVTTHLTLDHKPGDVKSRHVESGFFLDGSSNIDMEAYYDNDSINAAGCKVVTNVLVQGLLANINLAHNCKFKDSAEHLRYIISELERGFIEVADIIQH